MHVLFFHLGGFETSYTLLIAVSCSRVKILSLSLLLLQTVRTVCKVTVRLHATRLVRCVHWILVSLSAHTSLPWFALPRSSCQAEWAYEGAIVFDSLDNVR